MWFWFGCAWLHFPRIWRSIQMTPADPCQNCTLTVSLGTRSRQKCMIVPPKSQVLDQDAEKCRDSYKIAALPLFPMLMIALKSQHISLAFLFFLWEIGMEGGVSVLPREPRMENSMRTQSPVIKCRRWVIFVNK